MSMFRERGCIHFCIVAILLAGSPLTVVSQRDGLPWTGTWAVSPMRDDSGRSFNKQTLRQIVHTSVAGHVARIRISNVFGTQPLTVEDVHIAEPGTDSSILAGTDARVRFGGLLSVTVQPGAMTVSDRIEFHVPRLGNVVVSIYLPEPTGPATYHPAGLQTSYIADGDVSRSTTLSSVKTTGSYYFLTNLDVQDRSVHGSIVTLGASITDGYASTPDANRRWPNALAQRLMDAKLNIGVLNEGIGGNRLLASSAGESAETRFDRDVLGQPGVRWVIFSDEPINDLGSTKPPPASEKLIAGMKRLITRAHQEHVEFLCSTLTPYQGAEYWTQTGERAREQINAFIRSKASGCDAVVDQDEATHDPDHQTRYLPAYDSGDQLHPNDAGLQAIADAVNLLLFSRPVGRGQNADTRGPVHDRK